MVKDQENFSSKYSQMYDVEIRTQKALKALSIIDDFKIDTDGLTLLDIGCSSGIMTKIYSNYFSKTIGIDIDKSAIDFAINNFDQKNLKFFNISYNNSELVKKKFDVITCSHIYEHVDDPQDLMDTIYNLLNPGGICLFIAGNKLKLIEPHFKLPFLSYMPSKLGNLYIKLMKRDGEFYQKHLSFFKLKKLVKKFIVHDYTIKTIKDPTRFLSDDLIKNNSVKQLFYLIVSRLFYFIVPTYIWILEKQATK